MVYKIFINYLKLPIYRVNTVPLLDEYMQRVMPDLSSLENS